METVIIRGASKSTITSQPVWVHNIYIIYIFIFTEKYTRQKEYSDVLFELSSARMVW